MRVGRSAEDNEALTYSDPENVWLHARGVPGAHVVLRCAASGVEPTDADLMAAAVLAVRHSRAGGQRAPIPVVWARRRFVRKPIGWRTGAVLVESCGGVIWVDDAMS